MAMELGLELRVWVNCLNGCGGLFIWHVLLGVKPGNYVKMLQTIYSQDPGNYKTIETIYTKFWYFWVLLRCVWSCLPLRNTRIMQATAPSHWPRLSQMILSLMNKTNGNGNCYFLTNTIWFDSFDCWQTNACKFEYYHHHFHYRTRSSMMSCERLHIWSKPSNWLPQLSKQHAARFFFCLNQLNVVRFVKL